MTIHEQVPAAGDAVPVARRLFLGLPTWIKAGRAETGGALSLVEQLIPAGFESPWHVHHDEDESFYIIDGQVTVVVEDRVVTLGAGDYAFGPRGIAHGFRVTGAGDARLLLMTTGGAFAQFIHESSDPADDPTIGSPAESDLGRLLAAAERNGISILGPMPR